MTKKAASRPSFSVVSYVSKDVLAWSVEAFIKLMNAQGNPGETTSTGSFDVQVTADAAFRAIKPLRFWSRKAKQQLTARMIRYASAAQKGAPVPVYLMTSADGLKVLQVGSMKQSIPWLKLRQRSTQ